MKENKKFVVKEKNLNYKYDNLKKKIEEDAIRTFNKNPGFFKEVANL